MLTEGVNKERITLEKLAEISSYNCAKHFDLLPIKGLIDVVYDGSDGLTNVIDNHKRMIELYQKVENDVIKTKEIKELRLSLVREFLNENSA